MLFQLILLFFQPMLTPLQIKRLKDLHFIGYTHNDIKPENILIGKTDPEQIYLIDFGISSTFLDKNGNHIQK